MLAPLLAVDTRDIGRMIKRCVEAMYDTYKKELEWPSEEKFMEKLQVMRSLIPDEKLGRMVCVVDGSEIITPRSRHYQYKGENYSGKKHQYSVNYLIFAWLDTGEIFHVTPGYTRPQDQANWNHSKLREKFLNKLYGIIGDLGFHFNPSYLQHQLIWGEVPMRVPKAETDAQMLEELKRYNAKVCTMFIHVNSFYSLLHN